MVKNPAANEGDVRDAGSIPGWGRSPGGGHGNPLQYSCLENPMDRGAWQATVHKVAQSWTQHTCMHTHRHIFGSLVLCMSGVVLSLTLILVLGSSVPFSTVSLQKKKKKSPPLLNNFIRLYLSSDQSLWWWYFCY